MVSSSLEHQERNKKANHYADVRSFGGEVLERQGAGVHPEDGPGV